jgi:Na+-driven multidrug efflux pump
MWTKMACYFGLTYRATDFGPTAMASHNILMRIFFFFGCFGDALGQTAQSFLPATLYPTYRPADFRRIGRRIGVAALSIAAFNYVASRTILWHGGGIFTSNAGIVQCLRTTSIWTGLALALHPIVVSMSGTVIATRNFSNLVKVYTVTALVHLMVLSRATSFAQVWQALVIFQMVRLANYLFWTRFTPSKQSPIQAFRNSS